MKDILLTSETTVKKMTGISDNLEGEYLVSAIKEAQDMGLQGILGQALIDRLKWCVTNDAFNRGSFRASSYNESFDIDGDYSQYKVLLDKAQYYLAYKTASELCMKVAYKVANMGVVKTSDDKVQNATFDEVAYQKDYYTGKADYYAYMLQQFLLDNRADYPELDDNHCHRIHSNLYSAASCGLWLGGPRGKKRRT